MQSIILPEELNVEEIREVGSAIGQYTPYCSSQKEFHRSLSQFRWLFGGNQSGKSYGNMMDLALTALEIHPYREPIPMGIHWAATESWELVRDVLWSNYLSQFIPDWLIVDIWYGQDKVPRKVILKNQHIIEFKAFNQGRSLFQARQIDTFHGDEQCLHDFQGIFNEIQVRLIARNGYMAWSLTPIIPQIYLEERVEKLPDTDSIYYLNLNDNRKSKGGYLLDERVNQLIEEWPEEVHCPRVQGRFASYFGAVYKTYSRQIHVVAPFKIPDDWTLYRGFDFGFTNPFVCLWLAKDKDENWYVYQEYYQAKTGIQEHIEKVIRLSGNESYLVSYADPEDAEARDDLRKAGISTKCANKDVARGIETIQSKLKIKDNGKPSLSVFSTCRNTCREFATYHYPKGGDNKDPVDKPVSKDDHTLDALRYVLHSSCKGIVKGTAELV